MQLHEHQAKEILRGYGLPVSNGKVITKIEEVDQVLAELNAFPLVVKAQVHAGGRGKAGGVKLVRNADELRQTVATLLGTILKTYQCPDGKPVNSLLIEEGTDIKAEYYFSITLDRSTSRPMIVASKAGGMDIETVARESAEAIMMVPLDPCLGLTLGKARNLAFDLDLPVQEFVNIVTALYRAYIELDASLLEINPLVLNKAGNLILLDAKLEIDDNSLFRHKDLQALEDLTQIDPLEVAAGEYNLNYVRLDGNIACMVNGAGLAMTTMDTIKLAGGNPANFLDVGGGASAEQIANAMRILMSDTNVKAVFVNIFGGILRCGRLAQGLIDAARMVEIRTPVVVRLEGTNVEEGRALLNESGLDFIVTAADMWDGANKAVELAKKNGEM
ncbi:MAG: sucC [Firmicutes bacterium]|nr:sucC [Bacillota bacterium]